MANFKFTAPDGTEWDSEYERDVYERLSLLGFPVRRCSPEQGDSFEYTSTVSKGRCLECETDRVVQVRRYTPDIRIDVRNSDGTSVVVYVEAKGYWKATKRRLLRDFVKCNPGVNLLLVVQRDGWVTKGKSKYTDYAARYLKSAKCVVWYNKRKKLPPVITREELVEWVSGK